MYGYRQAVDPSLAGASCFPLERVLVNAGGKTSVSSEIYMNNASSPMFTHPSAEYMIVNRHVKKHLRKVMFVATPRRFPTLPTRGAHESGRMHLNGLRDFLSSEIGAAAAAVHQVVTSKMLPIATILVSLSLRKVNTPTQGEEA